MNDAASSDSENRGPSLWERLMRWGGLADDEGADASDADRGLDPHERVLIQNVLRLRDLAAWDVMVPRVDIVAVEAGTTFDKAVATFIDEGHSRLPVYKDDLDHIIGMIHVKDVLTSVVTRKTTDLSDLLRKVLFVAPTTHVIDLLTQMRVQRVHMAFVVDEFGGIDGLITIEDLVEEIVGEIEDEHDDASPPHLIERSDGTLVADARTPIEELETLLELKLLPPDAEEEVDTVGGLCFMLVGRVPSRGEIIEHPAGLTFEILEADERRVRRLRIRKITHSSAEGVHAA